ncbi:hypothetical protein [Anaeromyxobacter oryzae]|uniref:Terminase n=1 Tax=Anaeromyxobacter oryzae TaxID=2918170 RepID=A0ABM7WZH7_9BACT|nr:hypothetical protein [Anaeromyxobacter oryzae]BDG04942.1 hypothetical protein AMOR_39380 [Anaeromyxobacter oryzae]
MRKPRSDIRSILEDAAAIRGGKCAKRPDVLAGAFPEQRAFIEDKSPLKWALTTRRAAKTFSVGLQMVDDSFDYPNATYLFISLTREAARRQFWKDVLKAIDRQYDIGADFNESSLTMRMPNGAEIVILGADADEQEKDKLLGGKYRVVCVDEAASFTTDLRELVEGTLAPAVVDLQGQIILTSTPGNLYGGFFHEVTHGSDASYLSPPEMREPGWSGFVWTTDKNPYVAKQWGEQCERLKRDNPRITATKSWKQMREGRWVIDDGERVYRFDRSRNAFTDLPTFAGGQWHAAISCDLGYRDATGLLLGAWHDWDRHLYFVRSWKEWGLDISGVVARVYLLADEARRIFGVDVEHYLVDGSNRQAVEEMRRRHNVGFLAADKQGKEFHIEIMNDSFISGDILVQLEGCTDGVLNSGRKADTLGLADEYEHLTWHPKHRTPGQRKEFHPPLENALADCGLYLWRYAYNFLAKAPVPSPPVGTPEWFREEEQRLWDAEIAEIEARREAEANLDVDPMLIH